MNLSLIGMSGAGKSFLGQRVAAVLGYEFIDIDEELEKHYGKSLFGIIADLGDKGFVEAEAKMTIERSSERDGCLISTGGSIIYEADAMAHLKKVSKVAYLAVSFATIEKRVHGNPLREGRIVGLGKKTLRKLYDERTPLYEFYADRVFDVEATTPEDAVQALVDFMLR